MTPRVAVDLLVALVVEYVPRAEQREAWDALGILIELVEQRERELYGSAERD